MSLKTEIGEVEGHKKNIENLERKGNKVGHEYPGKGAAKTTVAGSIIDDFCILQARITDLGLLLVPINRDTLMSLKTEDGDVEGHQKQAGTCISCKVTKDF